MQIETHSRADSAPLFAYSDSSRTTDQSGSFTFARWLGTWGNESLATSVEAESLRMSTMEIMFKLYQGGNAVRNDAPLNESKFSVLVDPDSAEWRTAEPDPHLVKKQNKLAISLHSAFEAEPFEDGMDHPADRIIENALRSTRDERILEQFGALCLDIERPSFASSILRCLGRQTNIGSAAWRAGLVRNALATADIEIRDAAVQAAESWGGTEIVDILISHNEPEPWLRDCIPDIIDALRG